MKPTVPRLRAILCATSLAATAVSQVDWRLLTPLASPPPRSKAATAYDYAARRILLFGGISRTEVTLADTWSFDGTTWTQLSPATSPPARYQHAMASDLVRARIVMFSGWSGSFYEPGTWEWNGVNWSSVPSTVTPPVRDHHAMTFDAPRRRTVLFGGWNYLMSQTLFNDTWEWDGVSWTQVTTANAPSPRDGHSMCFDFARNQVVLFGGGRASQTRLGDTWLYDGVNWVQANPANRPKPRVNHRMAFDFARKVVVLFGGYDGHWSGGGTYFDDVWEWDGQDWQQRAPQTRPTPCSYLALEYDRLSSKIVGYGGDNLYGGAGAFGQTWEYGPTFPARHVEFGRGCPGSAGMPVLLSDDPWLGGRLQLGAVNLRAGAPALFVLGFSNTTSPFGPLPFSLDVIGMPGCSLLVDPTITASAPNPSGQALLTLTVPSNPYLLGRDLFAQTFAGDPSANRLGLVVTNGVAATVGGR